MKYLEGSKLYIANKARDEYRGTDTGEDDRSKKLPSYAVFESEDNNGSDNEDFWIAMHEAMLGQSVTEPVFRHAICVANQSEQSAFVEAISGYAVVPEGESPEFYIASCKERHASCLMCGDGPMFVREVDRLDLHVLGVGRQLYEEANHLLWATNTFSFEDPKTFERFFDSLNLAQKRNLTAIHISADIGSGVWFNSHNQRARWDNRHWGKALKSSNLNILRGVQTLHLCINQGFECVSRQAPSFDSDWAEQKLKEAQQADLESILHLSTLSIKHVTVVMSDDVRELRRNGKSTYRWTVTKKNEYAEIIRAKIVDSGGADLLKKETQAAKLARKTKIRDSAAARLKNCKSTLKSMQANMVRFAELASRIEASAGFAADRVSKKSSKSALKLQQDTEKQKELTRKAAKFAVEREGFWQEQVADAKEK